MEARLDSRGVGPPAALFLVVQRSARILARWVCGSFIAVRIWPRPANALATEVFAGRVVVRPSHMDNTALCGESG